MFGGDVIRKLMSKGIPGPEIDIPDFEIELAILAGNPGRGFQILRVPFPGRR